MAKVVNDNEDFFKYNKNRRKTKDNVDLLLNEWGRTLVAEDTKKPELLNVFSSVFTSSSSPKILTWVSLTQKSRRKEFWKESFPLVKKDGFWEHLGKLGTVKSMCPDRTHPKELVHTIARPVTVSPLKGCGDQERFLRPRRKPLSPQKNKKGDRGA